MLSIVILMMGNIRLVITVFFLFILSSFDRHPHHVGVIEVNYNAEKKELQIAGKWFVDDLEDAIRKKYNVKKDLVLAAQNLTEDSLVMQYFQQHLTFASNNQPLTMKCIGSEHEKGDIWLYFVIQNYEPGPVLTCRPAVFCDILKDQSHIVHFISPPQRQSYKSNCTSTIIRHKW
jgi:hypothetical protein